jgi:hypothetical protein
MILGFRMPREVFTGLVEKHRPSVALVQLNALNCRLDTATMDQWPDTLMPNVTSQLYSVCEAQIKWATNCAQLHEVTTKTGKWCLPQCQQIPPKHCLISPLNTQPLSCHQKVQAEDVTDIDTTRRTSKAS